MQYPHRFGRQRSFVRTISCILPLRPAPRIFFHAVKNSCAFDGIDVCHNGETPYLSKYKPPSILFTKSGGCPKPDLLLDFPTENFTKERNDGVVTQKLNNLEKELVELRQQMARIMATQLKTDTMQQRTTVHMNESSHSLASQAPPPPPPPPPPLPPFNCTPLPRLVLTRVDRNKPIQTSTPKRPSGAIDMTNILKDLGKVKLRHVERSPGGTPIRQPPPPTDPNTMLLVALKKRYAVMHDRTPEKPGRGLGNTPDSSFTDESPFKNPVLSC